MNDGERLIVSILDEKEESEARVQVDVEVSARGTEDGSIMLLFCPAGTRLLGWVAVACEPEWVMLYKASISAGLALLGDWTMDERRTVRNHSYERHDRLACNVGIDQDDGTVRILHG
jgi:hypothetical protein